MHLRFCSKAAHTGSYRGDNTGTQTVEQGGGRAHTRLQLLLISVFTSDYINENTINNSEFCDITRRRRFSFKTQIHRGCTPWTHGSYQNKYFETTTVTVTVPEEHKTFSQIKAYNQWHKGKLRKWQSLSFSRHRNVTRRCWRRKDVLRESGQGGGRRKEEGGRRKEEGGHVSRLVQRVQADDQRQPDMILSSPCTRGRLPEERSEGNKDFIKV